MEILIIVGVLVIAILAYKLLNTKPKKVEKVEISGEQSPREGGPCGDGRALDQNEVCH
jgi:hypothetical protein